MTQTLNYARANSIQFDLPAELLLGDFSQPKGEPLTDIPTAVAAAMTDPLEFPNLNRATVPGDVVAIVLEDDLPRPAEIVSGIVSQLLQAGVAADHILIAQTKQAAEHDGVDPRSALPAEIREQVRRVIHDPAVREELAFLAADKAGKAVYLNRALCDADLVIPVGCLRFGFWSPDSGAFGGLYPAFSDFAANKELGQQMRMVEEARKPSLRKVTDEVGWLLGSMMTVQIIPGGAEEILRVLCGEVQAVMKQGEELYRAAWTSTAPGEVDLVIAAVSGDARQQTWANVARAIAAARQILSLTGSIAICTELRTLPEEGVRGLAEISDPAEARELLAQTELADAAIAEEIAIALEQGSVYLLSELEADFVESLGLVPLTEPDQLHRLAERFASCVLLGHAQFALPQVEEH